MTIDLDLPLSHQTLCVNWQVLPCDSVHLFFLILPALFMGHWLLPCKMLSFHFALCVLTVGKKQQPNSGFLIKAKQTFTEVKESGKPGLLQSSWLSCCVFFFPLTGLAT